MSLLFRFNPLYIRVEIQSCCVIKTNGEVFVSFIPCLQQQGGCFVSRSYFYVAAPDFPHPLQTVICGDTAFKWD